MEKERHEPLLRDADDLLKVADALRKNHDVDEREGGFSMRRRCFKLK